MIWLIHTDHTFESFRPALYAKSNNTYVSGYLGGRIRIMTLGSLADTAETFQVASCDLVWAANVERYKRDWTCSPFQIDPRERSQLELRAEQESRLLCKRKKQ